MEGEGETPASTAPESKCEGISADERKMLLPLVSFARAIAYTLLLMVLFLIFPKAGYAGAIAALLSVTLNLQAPKFWAMRKQAKTGEAISRADSALVIAQRLTNCIIVVMIYYATGFWGCLVLSAATYELSMLYSHQERQITREKVTVGAVLLFALLTSLWVHFATSFVRLNAFTFVAAVAIGAALYFGEGDQFDPLQFIFYFVSIIVVSSFCYFVYSWTGFWGCFFFAFLLSRIVTLLWGLGVFEFSQVLYDSSVDAGKYLRHKMQQIVA